MLKHAWYVVDAHHPASTIPDLPPRLVADPGAGGVDAAVAVMLDAAACLSDTIGRGQPSVADTDRFGRLLHGVNHLLGYAAQQCGRLAYQTHTATGPNLAVLAGEGRVEMTSALAGACGRLEEAAGLVKVAYLHTVIAGQAVHS